MSPRLGEGTLEEVLDSAIRGALLETHTFLPGVIEEFDATTLRASVRVPLKRVAEDLDGVRGLLDWPLLTDLPVTFPHAGGFAITMPVAAGDEVLVGFMERDASRWLENHVEQAPETLRCHDLSDGVVLVGLNTKASQIATYNPDDIEIRGPGGDPVVKVSSSGLALTVGANELLTVIEELIDAVAALQASDPISGPLTFVTIAGLTAAKAKITAMKA